MPSAFRLRFPAACQQPIERRSMARKLKSDKLLFTATLLLVCTGIVMVYSASAVMAMERFQTPYLFLVPGLLWLTIFFVVPMIVMASVSLQEGSLGTGYTLTWNFGIYPEVINTYLPQFVRSLIYAVIVTLAQKLDPSFRIRQPSSS